MQTEANFIGDIRAYLTADLQRLGYPLPASTGDPYKDAHGVCVDHWNAYARRVSARPRTVSWSNELRAREPNLPADLRAGIAAAEVELQTGADVTPRLSRKLSEVEFNDKMLHDWGIHHLHLGTTVDPDGFVKRTGDVLFVMVRRDAVYLLDVRDHKAWTDDGLVDIVHTNWPDTIAAYRFSGVSATALTKQQRKNVRDRNANAGVTTKDGTFYCGIGGGLVASSANLNAIRWGDYILATAKEIEAAVVAYNHDEIADGVLKHSGTRPDRLVYRLGTIARDHALVIVENAAKPFVIKLAIARPSEVTIDLSS
jgi:hypothetical protein